MGMGMGSIFLATEIIGGVGMGVWGLLFNWALL